MKKAFKIIELLIDIILALGLIVKILTGNCSFIDFIGLSALVLFALSVVFSWFCR